jgi:hypothetical protein
MKNLFIKTSIERAIGFAIGFSHYSNKREINVLILCFTINVCWKVKPQTNQFIPTDTVEGLKRTKLSIALLTILSLLNMTMIVITELASDIPTMMNLVWGPLMLLLVIQYVIDVKTYKKLKRSIV